MENNTLDNNLGGTQGAVALPNSTAVLVLGILSIVFCSCYGIPGLIMGIIALSLGSKDMQRYKTTPGHFTNSSYNNLKAGRVCAIIGTILSSLTLVWVLLWFIIYGSILSTAAMGGF